MSGAAVSAPLFAAIAASAVMHVGWNIAAKRVSGHFGVMWLGQALCALIMLPFGLYFAWSSPALTPVAYASIAFCGLTQAAYIMLLSRAYATGDISMVYPIARGSSVALVAVGAFFVLKEPISTQGAVGIAAIGLGGVLVGLKPGSVAAGHRKSLIYSLLIALALASGGLNDKIGVRLVHPVTYMFCMFALAALSTLPLMLRRHREALRDAWRRHKRVTAIVGPGSMAAYLIVLFAFRGGPVSYIVALRELSVVLGAVAGVVIFKEPWGVRKALGIAVISAGLILVKLA